MAPFRPALCASAHNAPDICAGSRIIAAGPVIVALLSDDFGWVNAQRIEVAGGIHIQAPLEEASLTRDSARRQDQASGLWQTISMLCPSGPMTNAA
jgi:hypothetical protein